ncbi:MAG: hypothetical protein ONB46_08130 [candidate division KSB1 bacterium]|nr:hypothetical protein [candidate division KSB1 bacterium]MDZ7365761.1 hypothetical protein [candidate division KSB1 bacterium]
MQTVETMDWPEIIERINNQVVPTKVDAETAKRLTNRFILENLPDRFCAGTPRFLQFPLRSVWIVPVVLSYPRIGPVGQAGIAAVDTETGSVVGWTPLDEMKKAAETIHERKKADIDAAFSQAGNA